MSTTLRIEEARHILESSSVAHRRGRLQRRLRRPDVLPTAVQAPHRPHAGRLPTQVRDDRPLRGATDDATRRRVAVRLTYRPGWPIRPGLVHFVSSTPPPLARHSRRPLRIERRGRRRVSKQASRPIGLAMGLAMLVAASLAAAPVAAGSGTKVTGLLTPDTAGVCTEDPGSVANYTVTGNLEGCWYIDDGRSATRPRRAPFRRAAPRCSPDVSTAVPWGTSGPNTPSRTRSSTASRRTDDAITRSRVARVASRA